MAIMNNLMNNIHKYLSKDKSVYLDDVDCYDEEDEFDDDDADDFCD